MRFIDRICANSKDNNLGFNAVTHTWITIIILFITLVYLLINRMNTTINKYKKIETINSNEIWNNFLIDQTHIFTNNNSNGIELILAQSNPSPLPSMNNSINTNSNNHRQFEGYTETNTFRLSHLHSRLHKIKNNKYNNTKSKYDLNVLAPAALHPNNFGLSTSSINNIDLDLIVNVIICYNIKYQKMNVLMKVGDNGGFFYALLLQNVNNWPIEQMRSCGTDEGLADAAFIAGESGVDAAFSMLQKYSSTVFGVAIRAYYYHLQLIAEC